MSYRHFRLNDGTWSVTERWVRATGEDADRIRTILRFISPSGETYDITGETRSCFDMSEEELRGYVARLRAR